MRAGELLAYLLDDHTSAFATQCGEWMVASPRFAAFVERCRDKIRKKLRALHDEEGRRDLLAELAVAYHLLLERHFAVEYEMYAAEKVRGPDFTVLYKTHTPFNVEVKRLRGSSRVRGGDPRVPSALCDKLRQMPPSRANLLVLATDEKLTASEMSTGVKQLLARVERKERDFLLRHGFRDARDFFAHYLRLSGILAGWTGGAQTDDEPVLWLNSQAKHPLSPDLCRLLERCGRR
jgi:hypothetical protein